MKRDAEGAPANVSAGLAVVVSVEIEPGRVPDFLKAMEVDVIGSRSKSLDPGCMRFDLLRDRDDPNKFMFYEVYADDKAAAHHKTTAHYNSWASFKAAGGVKNQEVLKTETRSIPGSWAFHQGPCACAARDTSCAVMVTVDIKPDRVEDFLAAMEVDVTKSRDQALDPGCMRFDLLRSTEDPNKFVFYEAYLDDGASAHHKTTAHYGAWADFKASGGVEGQSVRKLETGSIPGQWAFQGGSPTVPTVELRGAHLPLLGFGTYKVGAVPASASGAAAAPAPPSGPAVVEQVMNDVLLSGYPMLDCAQFYMNEHWVGDALKKAGARRGEVFLASKVWNDTIYAGPEAVKAQVDKTISELQCGHLDLCLVHWPVPGKHVAAYNALREYKAAGKIKAIGVSNYCIEDLEELKAAGAYGANEADKPALNQFEVNPLLFRRKTIDYCRSEGVHVQAYRGIMQSPPKAAAAVPELQRVCEETGRAASQVLGRFLVQQGISHLPKASSSERMKENADIFSFQLTAAQMESLSGLTTPAALDAFKQLYTKCIWRDTPEAGSALQGDRTLD